MFAAHWMTLGAMARVLMRIRIKPRHNLRKEVYQIDFTLQFDSRFPELRGFYADRKGC